MKVIAQSQIKHDGKIYKEGSEIKGLSKAQLAQLEEASVVVIEKDTPVAKTERKQAKQKRDDEQSNKDPKTEVPNIEPKKNMGKEKLRGIGLARGLEIDKTISRDETFVIVKADFDKRGELNVTEVENPEVTEEESKVEAKEEIDAKQKTEDEEFAKLEAEEKAKLEAEKKN